MRATTKLHRGSTPLRYLPHLDGLRLILLLGVLLFHFELSLFRAGFLGVDGFFVLSGFLISRNILHSLSANTFSLRAFYLRRFWRLYPASLVIVATALLFAFLSFPSDLAEATARSALASLLLTSNVHFWRQSGYFDEAAFRKPLLHMWSLSLEEQFYLCWPMVLVLVFRKGTKASTLVLGLTLLFVSAISVALTFLLHKSAPAFVFFMLPCRLYEFCIGAFGALSEQTWPPESPCGRVRIWLNEIMSLGALATVVFSFTAAPAKESPQHAILLALATAAVIITPESACCRLLLGSKLLSWLGKLTYSAYLVHWVLFVFVRYFCNALQLRMPVALVLILATFIPAWVLRMFVEDAFRTANGKFTALLVTILWTTTTFSVVGIATEGWKFRFGGVYVVGQDGRAVVSTYRHLCKESEFVKWRPYRNTYSDSCRVGGLRGNNSRVVFIGDSFARQLIPALHDIGRATRKYFSFNFMTGCPLLAKRDKFLETRSDSCQKFEERRWRLIEGRDVPNAAPLPRNATIAVARFGRYSSLENRRISLTRLQGDLRAAGHDMIIVGEPPGIAPAEKWRFDCLDIDKTPIMAFIKRTTTLSSPKCVSPWMKPKERAIGDWEDYNKVVEESLSDVTFIDFFLWLCEGKGTPDVKCQTLSDSMDKSEELPELGYARDGSHLTRRGSEYLSSLIVGYLPLQAS